MRRINRFFKNIDISMASKHALEVKHKNYTPPIKQIDAVVIKDAADTQVFKTLSVKCKDTKFLLRDIYKKY